MKRVCTKCKEEKVLSSEFFHRCKSNKTGFMEQCKICRNKTARKYHHDNKEKVEEYRKNNRERINLRHSEWCSKNKDAYNKHKRNYYHKMKNDPIFKIKKNLRRRVNFALEGAYKEDSTLKLLGCTPREFKEYLESKFKDGMSWDNYGVYRKDGPMTWHVDHILPCDSFDLTKSSEQEKCFHYTNMQPLWANENIEKGNSVPL